MNTTFVVVAGFVYLTTTTTTLPVVVSSMLFVLLCLPISIAVLYNMVCIIILRLCVYRRRTSVDFRVLLLLWHRDRHSFAIPFSPSLSLATTALCNLYGMEILGEFKDLGEIRMKMRKISPTWILLALWYINDRRYLFNHRRYLFNHRRYLFNHRR